jgi:RimJ/RimL family protein N-acetyltransferase
MLTFERTSDYALVREIATHPKIYDKISDDQSPIREDYRPIESDQVFYVIVKDSQELLGMWMILPQNGVTAEIHTCLLPNAWGERAHIASILMARWIWEHTHFRRIVTNVPAYNRAALQFAEKAGMVQYGINPRSYMKRGYLFDQFLLGLSRPQEYDLCRPQH